MEQMVKQLASLTDGQIDAIIADTYGDISIDAPTLNIEGQTKTKEEVIAPIEMPKEEKRVVRAPVKKQLSPSER